MPIYHRIRVLLLLRLDICISTDFSARLFTVSGRIYVGTTWCSARMIISELLCCMLSRMMRSFLSISFLLMGSSCSMKMRSLGVLVTESLETSNSSYSFSPGLRPISLISISL